MLPDRTVRKLLDVLLFQLVTVFQVWSLTCPLTKGVFSYMSGAIQNHEFWQAPVAGSAPSAPQAAQTLVEACDHCGTEFIIGAGFCHVCGASRTPQAAAASARQGWTHHLEFNSIKQKLALNTTSMVAFLIGVACVVAALLVGFVFSASTVLDWQAVQVWRIQWLLASAASFLAAILLKSPRS